MNRIDHLIYVAPTLEVGIQQIAALLGVQPILGGQHKKWGTHNALLSLGNAYLEVLAPDPSSDIPAEDLWMAKSFEKEPHLATWVMQTQQIEQCHRKAKDNGIALGDIEAGKRKKPDGSELSWQLTDPYALPFDGALPFLIDWENSAHPSQTAPQAGELLELIIEYPQNGVLEEKLSKLDIKIKVEKTDVFNLKAVIRTANDTVILS